MQTTYTHASQGPIPAAQADDGPSTRPPYPTLPSQHCCFQHRRITFSHSWPRSPACLQTIPCLLQPQRPQPAAAVHVPRQWPQGRQSSAPATQDPSPAGTSSSGSNGSNSSSNHNRSGITMEGRAPTQASAEVHRHHNQQQQQQQQQQSSTPATASSPHPTCFSASASRFFSPSSSSSAAAARRV
jgi:hypothetical protein